MDARVLDLVEPDVGLVERGVERRQGVDRALVEQLGVSESQILDPIAQDEQVPRVKGDHLREIGVLFPEGVLGLLDRLLHLSHEELRRGVHRLHHLLGDPVHSTLVEVRHHVPAGGHNESIHLIAEEIHEEVFEVLEGEGEAGEIGRGVSHGGLHAKQKGHSRPRISVAHDHSVCVWISICILSRAIIRSAYHNDVSHYDPSMNEETAHFIISRLICQ